MAKSYNNFVLTGRLGTDPDYRTLDSGDNLVKLNLGLNRTNDKVDWFTVKLFGKPAGIAMEYLEKGMLVTVSGYISVYKENNELELIVRDLVF